jgi:hypothetical protein
MTVAPTEPIPAFVAAGLANVDPSGQVFYRTEADLRDTLAMRWWLAGAESVRTEVKVPDCGRIDVLVDLGVRRLLYEVKQRIETPTQARMAFQQAHAYSSYLETALGTPISTFVVAADYSWEAARAAEVAYYPIEGGLYVSALSGIEHRFTADSRLPVAERRSVLLARLAHMARGSYLDAVRTVEDKRLAELADAEATS